MESGAQDLDPDAVSTRPESRHVPVRPEPEATLEKLTGYLSAASASFASGKALSGPAAGEQWYDFAFALPGGAKESYLETMTPLVALELAGIVPLWEEP